MIEILSTLTLAFSKTSLLFLFRRIFTTQTFRRIVDGFLAVQIIWSIAFVFATIFQCVPVSTHWNYFVYAGAPQCIDLIPYYYALAITDVAMDIAMLILPIPMIWRLHLPIRKRLNVLGLLLLGVL